PPRSPVAVNPPRRGPSPGGGPMYFWERFLLRAWADRVNTHALTLRKVCRAGFCRPRHAARSTQRATPSPSPPTRDAVSGRRLKAEASHARSGSDAVDPHLHGGERGPELHAESPGHPAP